MVSSFRQRLTESVREHREALLTLASGGLLARLPWARLADSDIVALPLSIVSNVAAELGTVATIIEFVLLYVVYTSVVPTLIPVGGDGERDVDGASDNLSGRSLDQRPWFRRLVALASLGFAVIVYFSFVQLSDDGSNVWFLLWGTVWSLVTIPVLIIYLRLSVGELGLGHPAVEIMDAITPFESAIDALEKTQSLPEPIGRIRLSIWWLAVSLLLLLLIFLLGVAGGVLSGLFPLLEGLVIGWFVLERAGPLLPAPVRTRLPERERIDVDVQILSSIRPSFSSFKGTMMTMFTFLGIMIAAWIFSIGVRQLPDAINLFALFFDTLVATSASPVRLTAILLNGVSGVGTTLFVGTYGLWYWYRVLRRLPLAAVWWREARGATPSATDSLALSNAPSLPPGYMFAPSLLLVLFLDWGGSTTTIVPNLPTYLILAGISVLATLWTVRRSLRQPPQPPRSDNLAIPLALIVQLGSYFAGDIIAGTENLTTVTFIGLLLLMAYYLPDAMVIATRNENGWLRFGHGGYLLFWAAVFAVLSFTWRNGPLPLPTIVAAITASGGIALLFSRVWDDRFH